MKFYKESYEPRDKVWKKGVHCTKKRFSTKDWKENKFFLFTGITGLIKSASLGNGEAAFKLYKFYNENNGYQNTMYFFIISHIRKHRLKYEEIDNGEYGDDRYDDTDDDDRQNLDDLETKPYVLFELWDNDNLANIYARDRWLHKAAGLKHIPALKILASLANNPLDKIEYYKEILTINPQDKDSIEQLKHLYISTEMKDDLREFLKSIAEFDTSFVYYDAIALNTKGTAEYIYLMIQAMCKNKIANPTIYKKSQDALLNLPGTQTIELLEFLSNAYLQNNPTPENFRHLENKNPTDESEFLEIQQNDESESSCQSHESPVIPNIFSNLGDNEINLKSDFIWPLRESSKSNFQKNILLQKM